MSKESWLAEFYPVAADKVPKEEAVSHSLQKWKGLTPKALNKHGYSVGELPIEVSSKTCALCLTYKKCEGCPIVEHTGLSCDPAEDPAEDSADEFTAWELWAAYHNATPMTNLLQTLKDKEDEQRKLVS